MPADTRFEGWAAFDADAVKGQLRLTEYFPKTFTNDDVDVKIMYTGICSSDVACIESKWGPTLYPQVAGHEIVGRVVRVGSKAEGGLKEGDLVAVGTQVDSCRRCEQCESDQEVHCDQMVQTYGGSFSNGDKAWGGFANFVRVPSHFVFKVPDGLDPAFAAPLMCAGVTTFCALRDWGAGTERKDVGVVGVGGVGHIGILFAKALGANVTAISHSESKKADAQAMGCDRFIATHSGGDEDFKPFRRSLDLIICTTSDASMPLDGYLSLLRPGGHLVLIGIGKNPMIQVNAFTLLMNRISIGGSLTGSPSDIKEMLAFAAKSNLQPWIEKRDVKDINSALVDFVAGKPKYRFVLVNTDHGGVLSDLAM